MIRRNEGSILVVTLAFMLVFTLLGFWSIHYSFNQSEIAERGKSSAEAFWMADGAVENEYENLRVNPLNTRADTDAIPNAPASYTAIGGAYDVYSYIDSCPDPICGDIARATDPTLPVCTAEDRVADPDLCTNAERYQDPDLCSHAEQLLDEPVCSDDERASTGLGICPCEEVGNCIYRCQCEILGEPCLLTGGLPARCPCTIAGTCTGRCPCELTDPQSCPCHLTDPVSCQENMVGRCPCEWQSGATCCESWIIKSYGTVNSQSRAIKAKVGQWQGDGNLDNALETWGGATKNNDCVIAEGDGNAEITGECEQYSDFTFLSVFGKPESWFLDPLNMTHSYENPNPNFETDLDPCPPPGDPENQCAPVEGYTYIELTGNNKSLNINESKQAFDSNGLPIASILVIDTTGVDENKQDQIQITIAGNGIFRGIVWIIGEAQIVGGGNGDGIYGAVFVAGDPEKTTKMTGTAEIHFSTAAIAEALGTGGIIDPNDPRYGTRAIISWKEIGRSAYP